MEMKPCEPPSSGGRFHHGDRRSVFEDLSFTGLQRRFHARNKSTRGVPVERVLRHTLERLSSRSPVPGARAGDTWNCLEPGPCGGKGLVRRGVLRRNVFYRSTFLVRRNTRLPGVTFEQPRAPRQLQYSDVAVGEPPPARLRVVKERHQHHAAGNIAQYRRYKEAGE